MAARNGPSGSSGSFGRPTCRRSAWYGVLDLLRDHQALIPFGERYPEIREITYGPRRAGKG